MLGLIVVILVTVVIIASVITSDVRQSRWLKFVRQQRSRKELALSRQETELALELGHYWPQDEILPISLESYNVILMPKQKLIITLNRPDQAPATTRIGWLVLELTERELAQEKQESIKLIEEYLKNPRVMNIQRVRPKHRNN
jgi:hypothetical protein